MRAQISVSLFAVFVLATSTSCTTNQTAVLPPLPKVEAHVISSNAATRRTLASTTDESLLDAEFQQILNSDDTATAAKDPVNRVSRIFYRSQGLLNDYDAKIDEIAKQDRSAPGALQTTDVYARLVSAWMMRDEAIAKATYFYSRGLEVEISRDDTNSKIIQEMQTHAAKLNSVYRDLLLSAPNSTNRIAKQDLIASLIEINDAFHAYQLSHDNVAPDVTKRVDSFNELLKKQLIEKGDEMQAFYERNAAQLKRETEAAKSDADLNAEMERLLPDVKKHIAEPFDDRAPASAGKVVAGVGRPGLLTGTEFAKGVWAITLDDGPHPQYTLQHLANFKAQGLKGTFFWLAEHISKMKSIVGEVKAAGMTLGNHSYTHPQLTKLGASGLVHEIDESTAVDVAVYGFKPKFFRCPYGACGSPTSTIRQKIAEQGMVSVIWNVDSLDWQDHNPASIYARVKKQMAIEKHGIILFHDIHPQTIPALKHVMQDFVAGQKNGELRTVTIEEAMNELNSAQGMK